MADKDLTIGIKVTADTKGAADAAKAISDAMEAANKKPFQMPIDEAGLKAREEAIRLQKEQAKTTETVVQAEKKEVAQIQQVTAAQIKSVEVQKTLTTTANAAATAKSQLSEQSRIYIREAEKAKGKTGEAAMGFMAFSNSVQDAQYGLAGVINNIPGIVSGFGLGMGVAGALQIAAVGFKVLNDNFDLFGTKAKEASEAANKEAAELMELANKAYIAEKASLAMAAAQEKQADAAQQINGHYQEQIRLSNQIIAQKKAQADAEIASADAESAVAMARLQLLEATGQITKENAMIQRGQIQMQADARKQAASEAAETAKMIELRKQANAEEEKANALRRSAQELAGKGGGLMTAEQAETARKTIAGLEGGMVASQAAQAEFASQKRFTKLRLEQEKYQEMITRLEEEKAKLTVHEKAAKEAGVKSADELNKLVESQVEEARKSASAASQFRGQANATENTIVQGRGIFGLRQEAAAISTMAGVEGERARQREENAKAEAKRKKEQESDLMSAQRGALKIARGLGNDVSEGGIDALKRAALGIEGGEQSQIKELARLLALLAKRQTKQDAEVESLLTKVNDMIVAK